MTQGAFDFLASVPAAPPRHRRGPRQAPPADPTREKVAALRHLIGALLATLPGMACEYARTCGSIAPTWKAETAEVIWKPKTRRPLILCRDCRVVDEDVREDVEPPLRLLRAIGGEWAEVTSWDGRLEWEEHEARARLGRRPRPMLTADRRQVWR